MEQEIWKDIKNYEGNYQVSNLGRVKNIKLNRFLALTSKNEKGYIKVVLTKNGKSKTFAVHRLVARTFLDYDYNSLQVNHIDGNKENNKLSNLELLTHKENIRHAYSTGLFKKETIERVCAIMRSKKKKAKRGF